MERDREKSQTKTGYARIVFNILILTCVLVVFSVCDSSTDAPATPEINSISPTSGPQGISVTISGSGFSATDSDNKVTFNGVLAQISSSTATSIQAIVPQQAQSGAVVLVVNGQTAVGPNFTVDEQMPGITSIAPDSGTVGTEITITGMNFSTNASENIITFNGGVIAEVQQSSETELIAQVPEGSKSGPIQVEVDNKKTFSPAFKVITTGTVQAEVTTTGPNSNDYDSNGYELRLDNSDPVQVAITESLLIGGIEQGNHQIVLDNLAPNCEVISENPSFFDVVAGDTTQVTLTVFCDEKKRQIIYSSNVDGDFNIYTIDADCCDKPERITISRRDEIDPIVSPTGNQVAYISKDGSFNQIYVSNLDGTGNPIQITQNGVSNFLDTKLAWSPDGTRIVYRTNTLQIINADGSGQQSSLTDSTSSELFPAWSPDGTRIVYTASYDGDLDIYVKVVGDNTPPIPLTDNESNDGLPKWSPDGTKVIFQGSDGDDEIYIVDSDGTGSPVQLTNNILPDSSPKWSPDGTEIAFTRVESGVTNLYIITADGTVIEGPVALDFDEVNFEWSLDGLGFIFEAGSSSQLFLINRDASVVNQLTNNGAQNLNPVWGGFR